MPVGQERGEEFVDDLGVARRCAFRPVLASLSVTSAAALEELDVAVDFRMASSVIVIRFS